MKYTIKIKRIEYAIQDFEVEADNLEAARQMAIEEADAPYNGWGAETIYDVQFMCADQKVVVDVAWDRESSDIAQERGWDVVKRLKKRNSYFYDQIEFNTMEEAEAYIRGIDEGNGWDEPYAEAKIINQ